MKIWPVFKKEMRLYATSPIAYVVFFIFLAVMGWFFYQILSYFSMASMRSAMNPQMARDLNVTDSVMRPLFGNLSVILVLALMPFITMRLLAEERQTGTIELLLTYPLRDWEVLLGKYLAVLGLYTLLLVLTLLYPLTLAYFARVEWGTVLSGYIGMFLMGSAFLAIGLFASSLTASQIVAAAWTGVEGYPEGGTGWHEVHWGNGRPGAQFVADPVPGRFDRDRTTAGALGGDESLETTLETGDPEEQHVEHLGGNLVRRFNRQRKAA